MKQLIFIGLGFAVQWIASPHFIAMCGVQDDPTLCILTRFGIAVVVVVVLNVLTGKK